MSNPFATAEAWDVSTGTFLPAGNHAVKVKDVDGTGTSRGGYPQIELTIGNDEGEIRDWLVITPATVGKIVQVISALGLEPPTDDLVDPSDNRIAQRYLDTWKGREVGAVVRDEPDYNDPTKTRTRVKGYVPASKIKTDLPTPDLSRTGGVQFPSAVSTTDDLPF